MRDFERFVQLVLGGVLAIDDVLLPSNVKLL